MGDNIPKKQLGVFLKKERIAAGLSTRALGDKAGVDDSTIVRLEQGSRRSPRPDILVKLSKALNVDLADMFAMAGYLMPQQLPSLPAYLRVRYRYLPKPAQDELVTYLKHLHTRYGLNDHFSNPPSA